MTIESQNTKPPLAKKAASAETFGKLPAWFVGMNQWARLSRNEMAVLGVLVVLGDNNTRHCWPSRGTISKLSGVCEKSISAATEMLKQMGLIKKWRKGFRVLYKIKTMPPDYLEETGINWDTKEDKKPKSMDTYQKDSATGRFVSKKTGQPSDHESRTSVSARNGHSFESNP